MNQNSLVVLQTLFFLIYMFKIHIIAYTSLLQNGVFIMELFNWYSASFSLVVVSILEIVAVSYVYGIYIFILFYTNRSICWLIIHTFTTDVYGLEYSLTILV